MKKTKSILLLFAIIATGLTVFSCSDDSGEVDPCENISCLNGGTCEDGTCDCPEGFSGTNCAEEDLCFTQNIECLNGGLCVDGTCDCPDGYFGPSCAEEDLCVTQNIECLNGGECIDGSCDCPDGFIGVNCESVDASKIQQLLDNGISPKVLFDAGVSLEQLYGKMYERGIIFYLNTTTGAGLVAHTRDIMDFRDEREEASWGCPNTDISNLENVQNYPVNPEIEIGARIGDGKQNTEKILAGCSSSDIAARLCRDLGEDYFLPSRGELNAMYVNLHLRGMGDFAINWYWSSSESQYNAAWNLNFDNGETERAYKGAALFYVRAVKAF